MKFLRNLRKSFRKKKRNYEELGKSHVDGAPKKAPTGHRQASQYMDEKKADSFVAKDPSTNIKYNAPVDFLELRKRELKNSELEKERESIREVRERERLIEEDRLKKQKEIDKMIVERKNSEPMLTSPVSKTPPAEKSPVQKSPPRQIEIEPEELQLPEFGKAKYSFHPQGPGELEFRKGETIRILRGIDENWVEGEHNGLVGIFPMSYIELEKPTPKQETPPKSTKTQQRQPEKTSPKRQQQQQPEKEKTPPKQQQKWSPPKTNGYHVEPAIEEPMIEPVAHQVEHSEPEFNFEKEAPPPPATQEYNVQEGLGKAKYTFTAETENELSFKKGAMVTILKQVDDNWYEGELNGQYGIFPTNYIEIIEDPIVVELEPKIEKKVEVKTENSDFDFEKIFEDVLAQPISPKSKQQSPQETKPTAYEQSMNAVNDSRNHNGYHHQEPEPEPVVNNDIDELIGKGEPHRAVYTYNPSNDDEVDLKVGDIVHVLEKCDDGWYIGTCERTGVFGTFPGNYVTLVS